MGVDLEEKNEATDKPAVKGTVIRKVAATVGGNARAAFAMFSRIPVGKLTWPTEGYRYMLCFFPLVGLLIGCLSMLFRFVGERLMLGDVFMGAVLTLLPILVTGGIHVDGLMDTADALASWQDKDRRLEILKDSHVGAFGVIRLACVLLLQTGAYSVFWRNKRLMGIMAVCFVLSRCLSALGVLFLPKAKEEGMVASFSKESEEGTVSYVLFGLQALCAMVATYLSPLPGLCILGISLGMFFWFRHVALRYFGGTTGDLNGYFLCHCELACTLVLALGARTFFL